MPKTLSLIGALSLFVLSTLVVLLGRMILPEFGGMILAEFWTGIAIALFVAGLAVLGWGFKPDLDQFSRNRKIRKIEPRFAHLTVHYSQRTDTPDTPSPARPRLVANNRTKQFYWVSDLIEADLKQHHIPWHSHDGEKALRAYFRKYKYKPNENDPTPKELGI